MKRRAPIAVLVLALATGAAGAAPAKGPSSSDLLKEHIDALLQHRRHPDALPVNLPNPFDVVAGTITTEKPAEKPKTGKLADDLPPGSSADALAACIAKLRIGGLMTLKGKLHIIVNEVPREEGDMIVLDKKNAMTYLEVVRVEPHALVLRLNEATQTIRF